MRKLALILMSLVLSQSILASTQCLKERNPCNPDLLCTFKAEWYSKVFTYISVVINDPTRKGTKPKDGYYYDGNLYELSMAQARAEHPGAKLDEIKRAAGPIFEDKLEKFVLSTFEMPKCSYGGKLDDVRRTPEGYNGMYTDASCNIFVDYYKEPYDPGTFGQGGTACEELYTRDYTHELIHKRACKLFEKRGQAANRFNIDILVKEEAKAYENSMKLSEAQYRFLLAQCSDKSPHQDEARRQLQNINNLLQGFETRGSR